MAPGHPSPWLARTRGGGAGTGLAPRGGTLRQSPACGKGKLPPGLRYTGPAVTAQPTQRELIETLRARLAETSLAERPALVRRLQGLRRRLKQGKPIDRALDALELAVEAARERLHHRRSILPVPTFDDALPVNQRREEIADAIRRHQVVVICGETGSGKTTQIPKICLSLGYGAAGLIGHTQPRRIAARSVAARIASELGTELGAGVGYKVRFSDRMGSDTAVKLLTDGMLLAETQGDRRLSDYEVIIIDEAHERSLNIDFLLGYLHRLLPRRPDLKLIITSATIDPARFARHFGGAPVLEVSGRTYPVETRYRPLASADEDGRDRDLQEAILDAVDEVAAVGPGDILVFLSGEREIRETAESLRKHHPQGSEILPLYARLSAAEQNRVFQPHGGRRIVLATNVAETALTVPGIRYVIDPGTARISRYSVHGKIQRLPVEPISQASANQRAGRCGRVSAGLCVRLYAEADFLARPPYTEPEILRTNLAAVILQMANLGLGDVEDFPFLDPPDRRLVNDGFRLLHELQAVDEDRGITEPGRQLARLPVDPRLGRMLLGAAREGCLAEALVVVSALAIQDPRERPLDHQQAADEKHRRFLDERSDFLALIRLWEDYQAQARHLSRSQLRRYCRESFLSYVRMREWQEIHRELHGLVRQMGLRPNEVAADYGALHRALLAGLLGHIGLRTDDGSYLGARNRRFHVFPGSGLFRRKHRWVMAAELVETARVYARGVARIDPLWVESLAPHLVKRHYAEPRWERRRGQVVATERVTLYGLPVVVGRRVNYGPIDPVESRRLFIRHALVLQAFDSRAPFLAHNAEQVARVEALEARTRRRDLLVDEETLFDFYDRRVPAGIYSGPQFERWRRSAEAGDPELLFMGPEVLMARDAAEVGPERFPESMRFDGTVLPLSYCFEPGEPDDGVTLTVPLAALNQVDALRCQWLVPGLLEERVTALIRSLPRSLRRHFVPVPDYARALVESLVPGSRPLLEAMAVELHRMTGVEIPEQAWNPGTLPPHLSMSFRVLAPGGEVLAQGRSLEALRRELGEQARSSFARLLTAGASPEPATAAPPGGGTCTLERETVQDWDFGDLPDGVDFHRDGMTLKGYPALVDEEGRVALRLLDSPHRAEVAHRRGLRRLIALRVRDRIRHLRRNLPGFQAMSLHHLRIGSQEALRADLEAAILDAAFLAAGPLPRTRAAFEESLAQGRQGLMAVAQSLCEGVRETLAVHHEIQKRLASEPPLSWAEAVADIREQLAHLVYPGFVSATPGEWRAHLPRYLRAVGLRLDKLAQAPDRDRARMPQVQILWQRYLERQARHDRDDTHDPELERLRWMLEELRVSLFAQALGTAFPVSVKRCEAQWQRVRP